MPELVSARKQLVKINFSWEVDCCADISRTTLSGYPVNWTGNLNISKFVCWHTANRSADHIRNSILRFAPLNCAFKKGKKLKVRLIQNLTHTHIHAHKTSSSFLQVNGIRYLIKWRLSMNEQLLFLKWCPGKCRELQFWCDVDLSLEIELKVCLCVKDFSQATVCYVGSASAAISQLQQLFRVFDGIPKHHNECVFLLFAYLFILKWALLGFLSFLGARQLGNHWGTENWSEQCPETWQTWGLYVEKEEMAPERLAQGKIQNLLLL